MRKLSLSLRRTLKHRIQAPGQYLLDIARQQSFNALKDRPVRVLLASDTAAMASEEQYFPFKSESKLLREQLGVTSVHLLIDDVLRLGAPLLSRFDIICVKLSFRTPRQKAYEVVRALFAAKGTAKLVYMDGDDDSAIQWPELLPMLDAYVKKHVYRNRMAYGQTFVGKNNLTDYVHHTFGVTFDEDPIPSTAPVAEIHRGKILLGYNIALDSKIRTLDKAMFVLGAQRERPIDLVSRASVNPASWLFHLRKQVIEKLEELPETIKVLAPTERVSQQQYYHELLNSKICVSPFGYGEICWRDFEAIICGCLIFKPSMAHIQTNPDIFVAGETYVPLRWDYADLEEKCSWYLNHPEERQRIVDDARNVLRKYYDENEFVNWMQNLLVTLGLR